MPTTTSHTPRLHRPLGVRCVNDLGALMPERPRLDEASLVRAAIARTGLRDFGDDGYRRGLRVLLHALEHEAALNTIGRIGAARQVVDALATRLRFIEAEKRAAGGHRHRVERPIFVLGLPRTGTTLLHGLLASDPALRSPLSAEVARPCPVAAPGSRLARRRAAEFDGDIDNFRKLAPGIDAIHPMGAHLPQECLLITTYELTSMQFELCFDVPSYQRWYLDADLRGAYGFHRRFLTLLGAADHDRRWVLKSPAHLGSLDALFDEYPDAVVIQTHRDPLKVLASVSSLHFAVRGASSDATDARRIGAEQSALWSEMLDRNVASRSRPRPSNVIVDVLYRDLVSDPIGVLQDTYTKIGMHLTPDAEARMRRFLADNARDKHGRHAYDAAAFGIDPRATRARFRAYTDRFSVPIEDEDHDAA